MAVKKQPESGAGELSESANDWLREFLKHLELFMVETGQGLRPDSQSAEYRLAAMRAVKLTLLDSGMDDEEIVNLFVLSEIRLLTILPSRLQPAAERVRRSRPHSCHCCSAIHRGLSGECGESDAYWVVVRVQESPAAWPRNSHCLQSRRRQRLPYVLTALLCVDYDAIVHT